MIISLTFLHVKLIVIILSINCWLIKDTIGELFQCLVKHGFDSSCETLYFYYLSDVFYFCKFMNSVHVSHVDAKFTHVHF